MDIKLINEKEEPLLSRKISTFTVEFPNKTPSKEEVKKNIVSLLKVNEDVIALKKVGQEFGERKATVTAYVYKDAESLKKFGEVNKKIKKGEQKKAAPVEKPKKEAKGE